MERQIERGCGLDVHRDTVAACVRVPGPRGERAQHVRTFGTTAAELLLLRDWLEAHGVTHVAMESTGVYWIAQLLEHGLLRGSFVPPAAIRELRDLTRHRKVLIQERQRAANRLHTLLQDAGIKLASVATDILGVSGRAMLAALVQGTTDPEVLADLARGKRRKKLAALRQVLAGRFRPHHAFLVSQLLAHVDYLDEAIATVSEEVDARLAPFATQLTHLDTVPGIARRTAEGILAEVGGDMRRFPSDRHLASWAGMCPGTHESAGKHKSAKTRKGNRWLRMALVEAALSATRTKDSALAARYRRVMRHRGHKKAVVAVAHAMLRAVYHVLADGTPYRDPGPDYYDRRHAHRVTRRAVELLERQGYRVVLDPAA